MVQSPTAVMSPDPEGVTRRDWRPLRRWPDWPTVPAEARPIGAVVIHHVALSVGTQRDFGAGYGVVGDSHSARVRDSQIARNGDPLSGAGASVLQNLGRRAA